MDSKIQLPFWRLLVIEDDPLVQLGIEKVLAHCEHLTSLGVVDDGFVGLEIALREKPELVITNVDLRKVGSIEVTQKIKAALPKTKVIIFTSHTEQEKVLAAFASGANAYCIKGKSLDVLATAITTVAQDGIYLDAAIADIVVQNLNLEPPIVPASAISEREYDVLHLLVEGLTNPEIAKRLYISTNTVKAHIRELMNKLSASNRVQVAVKALRTNLV